MLSVWRLAKESVILLLEMTSFFCFIFLLDSGVDEIIEGSHHLISHFNLCEVVGMANVDASGEFLYITLSNEFNIPVVLTVVPSFLDDWATTPFTPSLLEATALEGILGNCGYHGCLGDGNCSVHCEVLTHFLFS